MAVCAEVPSTEATLRPFPAARAQEDWVRVAGTRWALETSRLRVEEAEATGSEALVTACPFCLQSLITGIQAADSRLPAVDLTHLLVEKAGFEP